MIGISRDSFSGIATVQCFKICLIKMFGRVENTITTRQRVDIDRALHFRN